MGRYWLRISLIGPWAVTTVSFIVCRGLCQILSIATHDKNNGAMRRFVYRTLAMHVRGGIIFRLNAYGRDKISTKQNGIFCTIEDDQSWNDHRIRRPRLS
ncbi:hypothetical protein EDD22DRAFT_921113 [Suillus occidentalis]|nr:hypothetical protein EDD22DRAFT_921113 [Suillus occidentalis]